MVLVSYSKITSSNISYTGFGIEGGPIHTVVLLRDSKTGKIWRFSDGKKNTVTVEAENRKRCTNEKYKGVVIVK